MGGHVVGTFAVNERRVVLLGLGFWGRKWYESLTHTKGCSVAAIAAAQGDLDLLRQDVAVTCPTFTDFRLAIDTVDADAAVIVLPTHLHVDAGCRALEKGLHVLSEKPLASDLVGAIELRSRARCHPGQVYMVNQNYRARPHNEALRRLVADGELGTPGSVRLEFRQPEFMLGERATLEMPLIQDVGIHHFDLIRLLLAANAREIVARSYRPPWSGFSGLPATEAIIEMDSGVVVGYSGTYAARGQYTLWDGQICVTGSRGCATLDTTGTVRLFRDERHSSGEWSGFGAHEDAGSVVDLASPEPDELATSLRTFFRAIDSGQAPPTNIEDNFHSFAIVAGCMESARLRKAVRIAT